MQVRGQDALTDVDGLANVTSVGDDSYMEIAYNDALTNLDGLSSLTSVGGGLNITSNLVGLIDFIKVDNGDNHLEAPFPNRIFSRGYGILKGYLLEIFSITTLALSISISFFYL